MILEILNLHRGGRATQRGGGHRQAVPGGFGLVPSPPGPSCPSRSASRPSAAHPGPPCSSGVPRCPPRSASRSRRESSRTPRPPRAPPMSPAFRIPALPRLIPDARAPPVSPRCPPCGSSRIPAPAPRSPGVPPAPHSSAVTQGSAPGSAGSHAAPTPGTPTRGWRRRRSLVTPPARQRGPQTPRDRPHGARPLLLAGAGHRGVEGGAGVQGGLLAKTLRGDKEGQRGERRARRGQPRAGGSPSHRGQVGDNSVPADRGQHVHGPWVAGAAGMG